jgi:Glycosyl transferase family 2
MMTIDKFLSQVAIITVLYNKRWADTNLATSLGRIYELSGEGICTIVVDNSPVHNHAINAELSGNVTYIENKQNEGISKSYNTAAEIAIQKGKKWLWFFDQDFTLHQEFALALYQSVKEFTHCNLFCPCLICNDTLISPYQKKLWRSVILKNIHPGIVKSGKYFAINNGLFVTVDAFSAIGGYNPAIPLDFSDDYFIMEYAKKYNQFCIIDYTGEHKLSSFERYSKQQALSRFDFFCKGAAGIIYSNRNHRILCVWVLLRAFKLVFLYKEIKFLGIFRDQIVNCKRVND